MISGAYCMESVDAPLGATRQVYRWKWMEAISNKRPITGRRVDCEGPHVNNRAHAQKPDSDKQFSISQAVQQGADWRLVPTIFIPNGDPYAIAFYYGVCRLKILLR